MKIYSLVIEPINIGKNGKVIAGIDAHAIGHEPAFSQMSWLLGIYESEELARAAYDRWSNSQEGQPDSAPIGLPEFLGEHSNDATTLVRIARISRALYHMGNSSWGNDGYYTSAAGRKTDYREWSKNLKGTGERMPSFSDYCQDAYTEVPADTHLTLRGSMRF